MKFSQETIRLLKNFANINNSIHLKQGNRVVSVHPQKVIMAESFIEEEIPVDCAIFSLNSLLSLENVFSNPDYIFGENQVTISSDERKVELSYCQPECIFDGYEKSRNFVLPDNLCEFELSPIEFNYLKQLSTNMRLPHIVLSNRDGKMILTLCDLKNSSLGKYESVIKTTFLTDKDFRCSLSFANLKIIENDNYKVTLSSDIMLLNSVQHKLKYWVLLQNE